MSAVKTVTEKIGSRGDKNATLTLEDGSQVWTPSYDKALTLIGKEIPSDWTVKEGNWGPMALPPPEKKGGGGGGFGGKAAWANTEEGLRYTQERMDRRTALMQAVEHLLPAATNGLIIETAELLYDWLRETSPAVPSSGKAGVAETVGAGEQSNSPALTSDKYPSDWPREAT